MPARATGRLRGTSPGKVSAQAEVNADTIADFVRTHSYRGHSHAPMANTLIEWYRMIWQLKISIVVCLIDPQEIPPSERYFALKEGKKLKIKNRFKISTTSVREHDGIIVNYELRVTNRRASSDKNRVVYVIVRPTKDDTPIEPRKQLNLIAEVWATETATSTFEENSETPPILVHSCNGVSRTAAFVATAMLCKSLETQGEMSPVEVWSRLNQVRHNAARECFHFISSIECALVYAFDIGLLTANINQLKDVNKVIQSAYEECGKSYAMAGIKE